MTGRTPRLRGKLVRDLIPQIIREKGCDPVTYTASPAEYRVRLWAKLSEEVAEFQRALGPDALEELADVLEVVHALSRVLGSSPGQLEAVRAGKAKRRGGFSSRTVWTGNR